MTTLAETPPERSGTITIHPEAELTGEEEREAGWAGGFVMFAGILMLVVGVWHALAGIAALLNDKLYMSTPEYLYSFDLTGWGWAYLAFGVLVAAAGGAVLKGLTWGRVVGVVLAALSLIANFLFLPWYPIWSLVMIALDVIVIWALVAWSRRPFDV